MLNYANNKNAFIRKESNGRFSFKVASEILRHDQHIAIPGGRIREIQFFVCGPRGPTPSGFAYEIYKSHDLKIDL